ncbi:MAG TPA: alpha/beta hydrolase-fold protein [Chitinophagaceae bacterium]|nr:alpha/beta hydrolase-fold protein [Chitinophagaceae bacterium]
MHHAKSLNILIENEEISSVFLSRTVRVDFYSPAVSAKSGDMSLLLLNDGQDLAKMAFEEVIDNLYNNDLLNPLLCVGIHCGADRKMEYGTAGIPDYKGRGAKATFYTQFILAELIPYIQNKYPLFSFKEKSFAGFSLGGLSALDIAWNYPQHFSKVGVFSGSLWWRNRGYDNGYNDETDKIMHAKIRNGNYHPSMKFFLQCGAADESEDRNNNGIIDSIDDTLDLIKELKKKGYNDVDIKYLELADGKHDIPTWKKAFPDFLKWGWGK